MKTTVSNMINSNGNAAANQFILTNSKVVTFMSYKTIIAKREHKSGVITIDSNAMEYSRTTSKFLYLFLGMNRKEIERNVKGGIILVEELNK